MTAPTRENLRFGYRFEDLWAIARNSAVANRFLGHDQRDLVEAALDSVVDLLLDAQDTPSPRDLYAAGKTGIQRLVKGHRQTYGFKNRDGFEGAGSAPMFARYWAPTTESPFEDRVVEAVANDQIMAVLPDRDRSVFVALAVRGSNSPAAESLAMRVGSYSMYLSEARRRYFALWHEGETPRKVTGYISKRVHNVELKACGTYAALRRHRKNREPIDEACRLAGREFEQAKKNRERAA